MLDFMRRLHVRTAPNKTAWSSTLEEYLKSRGYTLGGQDVIRRKLTSSLRWFTYLVIETEEFIRKFTLRLMDIEREADGEEGWEDTGNDEEDDCLEYLADCCPLCFGNLVRNPGLM